MRPREALERLGVQHVSDDCLLAVLLRSGVRGVNVVDLAGGLLREYGSLTALAEASLEELAARRGMGRVKAQVLAAALELARRLNEEAAPKRCRIRRPDDAAALLRGSARVLQSEVFWVLLLDAKNRLKGRPVDVSRGLLDASLVHPREVFREAIRSATGAVVLVHNHPSGDPTPSAEDLRITKQLVEAGRIVDIRVLDHVILGAAAGDGGSDFLSMREEGLARFE
jgi:DNA repair protein RadC